MMHIPILSIHMREGGKSPIRLVLFLNPSMRLKKEKKKKKHNRHAALLSLFRHRQKEEGPS